KEICGKNIPIISTDEFSRIVDKNSFLMITCAGFLEIITQLNEYSILNELQYIAYESVKSHINETNALNIKLPQNIKLTREPIIPQKIHYCWFGGNPIPDKYKKWMESWHKYCPDYEIIEWNENNYNINKNLYMKQAYENKKWGFVPDYARLDIIYNNGGIYLDTDVEIISNLDDLLFQNGFAGFESKNYVNLGLGFGAVKHHKMIKAFMQTYENICFVKEDYSLNLTPSPIYQTDILLCNGLKKNGEYQIVNEFTIFPEKTFAAKSVSTRQINTTVYSKSIHHFDASWKSSDEKSNLEKWEKYMQAEK
ncbi:MAG: hypothetical protein IKL31_02025, partial [Ruminococcus sp.]|nr:hypothetical protein [Ruminococcus sp.]